MQIEKIVAKFALKNQRNFTTDGTYSWMFLFSKHFLKLISECLLVSYSPSRALKKNIFAYFRIPIIELLPLVYPEFTYFHLFSPIFTYFRLFSSISTYFQLISTISTYLQLFSTILNYFQLFLTIFNYFHLFMIPNQDKLKGKAQLRELIKRQIYSFLKP